MDKRIIPVETKGRAEKRAMETLFRPINGKTATKHVRWDMGKYQDSVMGRETEAPETVAAFYAVKRKDRDGPYRALYAIVTD